MSSVSVDKTLEELEARVRAKLAYLELLFQYFQEQSALNTYFETKLQEKKSEISEVQS